MKLQLNATDFGPYQWTYTAHRNIERDWREGSWSSHRNFVVLSLFVFQWKKSCQFWEKTNVKFNISTQLQKCATQGFKVIPTTLWLNIHGMTLHSLNIALDIHCLATQYTQGFKVIPTTLWLNVHGMTLHSLNIALDIHCFVIYRNC